MIATRPDQSKPSSTPLQPYGWPINAHRNVAVQARADAADQRRRVHQLERRNRQLRWATGQALTLLLSFGIALLAFGLVIGYSVGVGLLGAIGR